ncbi:HEPN domain-containing protein [Geminocystis herdmanii]|uniref:HEPN domain-containing protein n=1 Tax=Geminocystis herdmanii TaxID=669359 RepID=UPI000344CE42|nr:HEPN domain-containing protein [Geminocystis herdmanii]
MNENEKQFLLKAKQSLEASKHLFEGKFYDFAVARAYYTMFYLASAFLAQEELYFSKHSAVISAFGREFIKTQKIPQQYHKYLREVQNMRNLGDYGDYNSLGKEEAQLQIDRAENFLQYTLNLYENIEDK